MDDCISRQKAIDLAHYLKIEVRTGSRFCGKTTTMMTDGQISLADFGIVPRSWLYDEDTGSVMCRCPVCGGRMRLDCYAYWNPYHYCPYCGEHLSEGRFVNRMVEVYDNLDRDTMERVRKEYGKEGDTIGQNMDTTGKR